MKLDFSGTKQWALATSVMALALTACGTRHVSRDISNDGRAGEVVFPKVEDIVLKEGTFPNLDNLRAVGPGVTKDQLYHLLGRPHFREGYGGVREWDYLFHFRKDGGDVITCQYKVIFDKDYHGQSFHWAPESCADVLKPMAPPAASAPAPAALPAPVAPGKPIALSADTAFSFGKAELSSQGRSELSALAAQLKSAPSARVAVVGHTDRIGSDAANQALSERRAQAVRQYLLDQGVTAAITAEGRGERQPVKECEAQPRNALIACLAPNRRVEIAVEDNP